MNILSLSPRQACLQWATGPIMSSGIEVAHQKCVEMSKLQKTDLWLETNIFSLFPFPFLNEFSHLRQRNEHKIAATQRNERENKINSSECYSSIQITGTSRASSAVSRMACWIKVSFWEKKNLIKGTKTMFWLFSHSLSKRVHSHVWQ